ncbi:dTDP-4-dehydrorhamnose 3,5-epimerase family protein [Verrucomicrobiaceae bacterium R5-34]|nr:dTDP-4-dehydrorhamnose 3,5-epimerase family protein [Verrucomicrobiaceae bacterium R5-34]
MRDERPDSPTFGHWQLYRLFGADLAALTFPVGIVHGWYFHTPSMHLQAVSESYVDYGADDNIGVHWADPALEIPWEFSDPVIAQRAAEFGSLENLRSEVEALRGSMS